MRLPCLPAPSAHTPGSPSPAPCKRAAHLINLQNAYEADTCGRNRRPADRPAGHLQEVPPPPRHCHPPPASHRPSHSEPPPPRSDPPRPPPASPESTAHHPGPHGYACSPTLSPVFSISSLTYRSAATSMSRFHTFLSPIAPASTPTFRPSRPADARCSALNTILERCALNMEIPPPLPGHRPRQGSFPTNLPQPLAADEPPARHRVHRLKVGSFPWKLLGSESRRRHTQDPSPYDRPSIARHQSRTMIPDHHAIEIRQGDILTGTRRHSGPLGQHQH